MFTQGYLTKILAVLTILLAIATTASVMAGQVDPDVAKMCRGKTRQGAPDATSHSLRKVEAYLTVREILPETSKGADGVAWREFSGFGRQQICNVRVNLSEVQPVRLGVIANPLIEAHQDGEDPAGKESAAGNSEGEDSSIIEAEFGLSFGYREDDLDWNIAGNTGGNNPNVLSELKWDGLQSFQIRARAKTILFKRIYFRGAVGYAWILGGEVQDSDFEGDSRTLEFSRSNNSADNGELLDASLAGGYQFSFALDGLELALIPLIGYSYHEQNLTLTDGVQTIPPSGAFPGLHSKYETEWKGPWLGVDFVVKPSENLGFYVTYEYHWADYSAEADWNLRAEFSHPKSFEHEANGGGQYILARGQYFFATHWAVNLDFDYRDWSTGTGTDNTFLANGTTVVTRLNEVNWKFYALMLGITYRF